MEQTNYTLQKGTWFGRIKTKQQLTRSTDYAAQNGSKVLHPRATPHPFSVDTQRLPVARETAHGYFISGRSCLSFVIKNSVPNP